MFWLPLKTNFLNAIYCVSHKPEKATEFAGQDENLFMLCHVSVYF